MLPKRNCLKFVKYACVICFIVVVLALLVSVREKINNSSWILSSQYRENAFNNATSSKNVMELEEAGITAMFDSNMHRFVSGKPNYKVHTFYYPWYGNPLFDGDYLHWNHEYLSNWDKNDRNKYPEGRHQPPNDIGANFYPSLGCYSSRDESVVSQHMKWIRDAGIGTLVISWYPPNEADKEGKPFDKLFPLFLDTAAKYDLKVAFHVEPYIDRNPKNLKENIEYIIDKYGDHPALYKFARNAATEPLPVFYIYDSYLNTAKSWSALLKRNGDFSIRGTPYDGIFLGLLVELRHKQDIMAGGFDGFFTYFAANEFTYGSSWKNWKTLGSFARKKGLLFVPSVGPGYIDTRVRPWNSKTTRERKNGNYYRFAWKSAIQSLPALVSITSFNEWHEGTQIEPAVEKEFESYTYESYSPNAPDFYLNLTRKLVDEFSLNNAST